MSIHARSKKVIYKIQDHEISLKKNLINLTITGRK